jgi:hypothetical protein
VVAAVQAVDFDLDAVERETTFKPFTFTVKDPKKDNEPRVIVLSDPAELDYQKLLEIESPIGFLRYVASQPDRDFLAQAKIEGWRLGKLMEAYYRHYNLDQSRAKLGF